MTTKGAGTRSPLTDEHKEAMSLGAIQNRAIRAYLEAINSDTPKRVMRRSADLATQLAESTDPIERLKLRPLLREALERESSDATANFIKHCSAFSEKFGITYADWREEGVPASVLKEAGLTRAS